MTSSRELNSAIGSEWAKSRIGSELLLSDTDAAVARLTTDALDFFINDAVGEFPNIWGVDFDDVARA